MYVVITLLHTGGEANNHPAIFAAYAASDIWTGVHVAQFACMAIMLAGLLALFFVLDAPRGTAGWAARFGAVDRQRRHRRSGVVLGVDAVALKQAEVLNVAWMVWLLIVARRMPDREPGVAWPLKQGHRISG